MLCQNCSADADGRNEQTRLSRAAGYLGRGNTPEYKRKQREREAARIGRVLPPYVSKTERWRQATEKRVARLIERIAVHLRAALINGRYLTREEANTKSREYYWRHRMQEATRTALYKSKNGDQCRQWELTRRQRMRRRSRNISAAAIRRLKAAATHCAYCGGRLLRRETDHMTPLVLGGEHSLDNIVIVCPDCNARKARLSYAEWIDRVDPIHQSRVISVWKERFGVAKVA